jgi:ABC-2 type transport system permease protein
LFHDVRYLFEAVLLVWFYATPIVYPAALIPERYSLLLWLNPFYWLLEMLRAPLWSGLAPEATTLFCSAGWTALSLAAGWTLFSRLQRKFHLYM